MTAPKSTDEDDSTGPQTPRHTTAGKKRTPNTGTATTPVSKASTPGEDGTPNSTPTTSRRRSSAAARQHPSLLGDFLLGRPTPARVAADRQAAKEAARARRESLELIKKEMRQASVMRIQAPGGVHDRVKKWQKANAAAMAAADPFATPTEPSEVHIQVDDSSVTEEDRVRIKMRQKRKPPPNVAVDQKSKGDETEKENQEDPKAKSPPKKRVVSDTNWVKNKKANAAKNNSPKPKQEESAGSPLPKDFVKRTSANPAFSRKIQDWAKKVEIPDESPTKRHGASRSLGSSEDFRTKSMPSLSEATSAWSGSSSNLVVETAKPRKSKEPEGDGIRVKPMKKVPDDDGIRVAPLRKQGHQDDGIRIKPAEKQMQQDNGVRRKPSQSQARQDDGIRVKPLEKKVNREDTVKAKPSQDQPRKNDSKRVKSQTTSLPDDGIRVFSDHQDSDGASTVRASSSRQGSRVPSAQRTRARKDAPPSDYTETEVTETTQMTESDDPRTATTRSSKRNSKKSSKVPSKSATDSVATSALKSYAETGTTVTDDKSDNESWTSSSDIESDMPSSVPPKPLAEIPFGYSAFSVLDLPSGARPSARPKANRQTSFKGATNVLKKALTEGRKILTEKVEQHPKPVANRPPNIETWLKDTVDPFVEETSPTETEPKRKSVEETWADENKTHENKLHENKTHENRAHENRTHENRTHENRTHENRTHENRTHENRTHENRTHEKKARHSTSSKRKSVEADHSPDAEKSQETTEHNDTKKSEVEEPSKDEASTAASSGLKRSRATRVSSSPLKTNSRRGLKDKLRDAFRGESAGHHTSPIEYPCCSELVDLDDWHDDEYEERRHSSSRRRSTTPDDDLSSVSAGTSDLPSPPCPESRPPPPPSTPCPNRTAPLAPCPDREPPAPPAPCPDRRPPAPPKSYQKQRPPTNGHHELSTIASEIDSRSTLESDYSSVISQTTVTESTVLSRSAATTRKRSQKSGLKRRLTKHSDLVSVLSLPDDATADNSSRNLRSARSVRRPSNRLDEATVDGLLQEFADDENLYQRELKTLVDGVIPVLLSQFVHGDGSAPKDLFGSPLNKQKDEAIDKAVVNMGVALEKLKNSHRRCPLFDVNRLPQWLEAVHAVYEGYLETWRLGFQGIIVNLAPASPDDEDSLIDAMPRNEQGDVLNEDGDRIDVAHLLKRPLVRIKWITKFIKGYRTITGTSDYETLASKWEALQEKARRRHKEEYARVVDDDAKYTDISRVRDLRTLKALDHVRIDRFRQVYAKDSFSLDLRHSNGQRLECQVELVYRDNPLFKSDSGDLLIRETGNAGRSWLLFAPITGGHFSARRGDNKHQLVVMIRGYKDEWFELIMLTADNEEQVLEWLSMLGSSPTPPAIEQRTLGPHSTVLSPKSAASEAPFGERKLRRDHDPNTRAATDDDAVGPGEKLRTPTRYHQWDASHPSTPTSASSGQLSIASPENTPTQDSYLKSRRSQPVSPAEDNGDGQSPPMEEVMVETIRLDPYTGRKSSPNSTPYRGDGAPPPPIHRTFSSKKAPTLSPPADKNQPRLKRRTSSPLKHEYHPSDVSSEESVSTSTSEDENAFSDESSEDELEAADIPDTTPAISIKQDCEGLTRSMVAETVASVTPLVPASQVGSQSESKQPEYILKTTASISYWDNKHGCWKDLWPDICSIVTTPGLIEAYPYRRILASSDVPQEEDRPLIALDLTPLVMLRNSTVVDLEIRSPVLSYARLYSKVNRVDSSFFRFRANSVADCQSLYTAVHRARMDNSKYKALEEETRIRAFGQHQSPETDDDGSSRRRGWFGRKNSYRASTRAPSQSAGSTSHASAMSASSFLKKLMGGDNQSFNILMSSVDRQSRPGSGEASMYTSSSSSATPPRSPSVSAAHSGNAKMSLTTNNLKIRLHLMVSASKWEDYGNCFLEVTRPDRGTRQSLRKYQGMEKRIIVTTIPKKDKDQPKVVLDIVLGSRCFSRLGSRGVLLNVWEEVKDESGERGVAPQGGNSGGNVNKWCFQCSSVGEASWIFGLVTQEVMII
ncbi:hypothetical protein F5B20DRAFT_91014 [Whalleya microplaca]|nr:hypothetical protein F5B20DRAFT_91014 [Whalleya microplaca]